MEEGTTRSRFEISMFKFLSWPRHSARGVGWSYVHTYVVLIVRNAHAWVMEAENSVTLTIYTNVTVFAAIYLPGLWIHNQDYEYCACSVYLLCIQLVVFLLQAASVIVLCRSEHICNKVALASSRLIDPTWTLYGGPVRWRFSGPFAQWPYWVIFHPLGVYTYPPPPVSPFLLILNQFPKEIAGEGCPGLPSISFVMFFCPQYF